MDKMIVAVSGIYAIRNIVDGKLYVGSSVNIRARFLYHKSLLRRQKHHSPKLQNAWNKYGEDRFVLDVLEIVESAANLLAVEQKWIDEHRSFEKGVGYNICQTARSGNRGVKQSPEFIARRTAKLKGLKRSAAVCEQMSLIRLGVKTGPQSAEDRAKKSAALKGRVRSPEHQAKLTAALLAFGASPEGRAANSARQTGYKPTEAARKAMSDAQKTRWAAMSDVDKSKAARNLKPAELGAVKGPLSENIRRKISLAKTGSKLSEETKRRIAEVAKGRRPSDETRLKMSEAAKIRWSSASANLVTLRAKSIACVEEGIPA